MRICSRSRWKTALKSVTLLITHRSFTSKRLIEREEWQAIFEEAKAREQRENPKKQQAKQDD